jgi:hypothetical protein
VEGQRLVLAYAMVIIYSIAKEYGAEIIKKQKYEPYNPYLDPYIKLRGKNLNVLDRTFSFMSSREVAKAKTTFFDWLETDIRNALKKE